MIGGGTDDKDLPEEDSLEDETTSVDVSDTEILTGLDDDNVGDLSVELNVEELVAMLDTTDDSLVHRKSEIRRRLEQIREMKEMELDSTYNVSLDDD